MTSPAITERTGVPIGAAKSRPVWLWAQRPPAWLKRAVRWYPVVGRTIFGAAFAMAAAFAIASCFATARALAEAAAFFAAAAFAAARASARRCVSVAVAASFAARCLAALSAAAFWLAASDRSIRDASREPR